MQLRIQEYRLRQGISLAELGRRVGRTRASIWYYEQGQVNCSVEMLAKLATALDCTMTELLGHVPDTPREAPSPTEKG